MRNTDQTRIRHSSGAELCEMFYTSQEFAPCDIARLTRQRFISQKTFGINDVRATLIECELRLFVVFRGTVFSNRRSALRNLDVEFSSEFGEYGVHHGYQSGLNDVWEWLTDAIFDAQDESKRPLSYLGHSQAGALATLAGVRAFVEGVSNDRSNQRCRPDEIVTFAAPRVGDQRFADWVDRMRYAGVSTSRYTASNDLVPRVPLEHQGYFHGSPELYLDRNAVVVENPWPVRRYYDGFLHRVSTKTWLDSAAAHGIDNYKTLLLKAGR